jgi:hypothetical protein
VRAHPKVVTNTLFNTVSSAAPQIPPRVGGCWVRTLNCCDFGIGQKNAFGFFCQGRSLIIAVLHEANIRGGEKAFTSYLISVQRSAVERVEEGRPTPPPHTLNIPNAISQLIRGHLLDILLSVRCCSISRRRNHYSSPRYFLHASLYLLNCGNYHPTFKRGNRT